MTCAQVIGRARKAVQFPIYKAALLAIFSIGIFGPNTAIALDVRNDLGGAVSSRIAKFEQLRAAGTRIGIFGA